MAETQIGTRLATPEASSFGAQITSEGVRFRLWAPPRGEPSRHLPPTAFVDFLQNHGELGEAVRAGRRREFPQIKDMPDPLAQATFRQCVLAWKDARSAGGKAWLAFYRELLQARREKIVPLKAKNGAYRMLGRRAFEVRWGKLVLLANCGDEPENVEAPKAKLLWSSGEPGDPWSVGWWLA